VLEVISEKEVQEDVEKYVIAEQAKDEDTMWLLVSEVDKKGFEDPDYYDNYENELERRRQQIVNLSKE
jgi:hypothetical protein